MRRARVYLIVIMIIVIVVITIIIFIVIIIIVTIIIIILAALLLVQEAFSKKMVQLEDVLKVKGFYLGGLEAIIVEHVSLST